MSRTALVTLLVLVHAPEEDRLLACLRSAARHFGRIIIGDAGAGVSLEPFAEVARSRGAEVQVVSVPNATVGDNRQRLMELVRTPLFMWIDDDDEFTEQLPVLLACAKHLFEDYADFGAIHGDTISVNAATNEEYELWSSRWKHERFEQTLEETLVDAECGIAGWVFNTNLLLQHGGCDRDAWYSEDFGLYIRAHAGKVFRIRIPVFRYWMPAGRADSLTTKFESLGDEAVRAEVSRIVQRAVRSIGRDTFGPWGPKEEKVKVQVAYSTTTFSEQAMRDLQRFKPRRVLDVGAGAGKVGMLVRMALGDQVEITAIDPDISAVPQGVYDHLMPWSIDTLIGTPDILVPPAWDLIVFGDVIEHLPWSRAMDVLNWCEFHSARTMLIWPTDFLVWGTFAGKPSWEHRANIRLQDLTRFDVETYASFPSQGRTRECYAVLRGPLSYEEGLEAKMLNDAADLCIALEGR